MSTWIVEQWTPDGHVWREVEGPFVSRTLAIARRDQRQRRDATRRFRVPDRKIPAVLTIANLSSCIKKIYDARYFQKMREDQAPLLEFLGRKEKRG